MKNSTLPLAPPSTRAHGLPYGPSFVWFVGLLALICTTLPGARAQVGPPNNGTSTTNAYRFTSGIVAGNYVEITDGTVFQQGTQTSVDDQSMVTLPFDFPFNGRTYRQVWVHNNGFVVVGPRPTSPSNASPLNLEATHVDGIISAMGANLTDPGSGTRDIRHKTLPNGDWVVQYRGLRIANPESIQRLFFQIRLSPSGVIRVIYGPNTVAGGNRNVQVGVRGSDVTDGNNRVLAAGGSWTSTGVGTSSASNVVYGTTVSSIPANNLTFTWTPGAATAAPVSYATLPYTQNFESTFVPVPGIAGIPGVLPEGTHWRAWPLRGDNAWRRDDHTETGYTTASGWSAAAGTSTPVAAPASGRHMRFQSAAGGSPVGGMRGIGWLDLHVNAPTPDNKQILFDYGNRSGSDSLSVWISADAGVTFTQVFKQGPKLPTVPIWETESIITGLRSAQMVIRFMGHGDNSSASNNNLGVDNIRVIIPECGGPAQNVRLIQAGSTQSTIRWNNVAGSTAGYRWTLTDVLTNTVVTSGTTGVGSVQAIVTYPFSPGREYRFAVFTRCGTVSTIESAPSFLTITGGQDPLNYAVQHLPATLQLLKGAQGTQYFSWTNGTNTAFNTTAPLNLTTLAGGPFRFRFGGSLMSALRVSVNGFLTFDVTTSPSSNGPLGGDTELGVHKAGGAVIAPFWENLACGRPEAAPRLDSSIMYRVTGTAPNRVLTIEWNRMKLAQAVTVGNGQQFTFQARLMESSDRIEFVYGTMQPFALGSTVVGSRMSYGIGLRNHLTDPYPTPGQVIALYEENTTQFVHYGANRKANDFGFGSNELMAVPRSGMRYVFTPGVRPVPQPIAWGTPPVNDNPTGAINLGNPVPILPPTVDGRIFTSRFATNSSAFNATIPNYSNENNDDVWFRFRASSNRAIISVKGSQLYQPCLEVHTLGFTPVAGSRLDATAVGQSITRELTTLTEGTEYLVRVWHKIAGAPHLGTATLIEDTISAVSITGGSGYLGTAPFFRTWIVGGGGEGAVFSPSSATAVARRAGGQRYTSVPTVRIEDAGYGGLTGEFAIAVVDPRPTWTGATSTLWSVATNWLEGSVPPANARVVVPSGTPNDPVITTGTIELGELTFTGAGTPTLTVAAGATLQLRGGILGQGRLIGPGAINVSGTAAQTLSGQIESASLTITNTAGSGLTLAPGATLTITPGLTLTMAANARLTIPATGRVVLASGPTGTARLGVMPTTALINGRITLERFIGSGTPNWHFYGAPFTAGSARLSDIAGMGVRLAPPNTSNIFRYTEPDITQGSYNGFVTEANGWRLPTGLGGPLNPGDQPTGYRVFLNAGFFADGARLFASGVPLTGNRTVSLTRTPAGYNGGGWNLLANPYPSEIDWNAVAFDPLNGSGSGTAGNAYHVYNGATSSYTSYTALSSTMGSSAGDAGRFIASSQSFFIRASTTGQMTFRETHKSTTNPNSFLRHGSPDNEIKLRIALPESSNEATVVFWPEALNGADPFDAESPFAPPLHIATLRQGTRMAINVMGPLGRDRHLIPVIVQMPVGVTSARISATGIETFPATTGLWLLDQHTQTRVDLRRKADYTLVLDGTPGATAPGRLQLILEPFGITSTQPAASTTPALAVWPNPATATDRVMITLPAGQGATPGQSISVYDALGRLVHQAPLALTGAGVGVRLPVLSPGHHTVRLSTGGAVVPLIIQ